ncbi:PEP-CTERM sorting domain-containing protein [Rhizobacter fulvus]
MFKYTALALALLSVAVPVAAQNLPGTVFTVTTDSDYNNPYNPYGYINLTDTPSVGNFGFGVEWRAGRAEFSLEGIQSVADASFSLTRMGVSAINREPAVDAAMTIRTYIGNGIAEVRDYTPTITGSLGSFAFGSLPFGTVGSFDVTQLVNQAIARGDKAFGIALDQMAYSNNFGTVGSLTLHVTPAIPEPSTYAMLLGGLALVAFARKRR